MKYPDGMSDSGKIRYLENLIESICLDYDEERKQIENLISGSVLNCGEMSVVEMIESIINLKGEQV